MTNNTVYIQPGRAQAHPQAGICAGNRTTATKIKTSSISEEGLGVGHDQGRRARPRDWRRPRQLQCPQTICCPACIVCTLRRLWAAPSPTKAPAHTYIHTCTHIHTYRQTYTRRTVRDRNITTPPPAHGDGRPGWAGLGWSWLSWLSWLAGPSGEIHLIQNQAVTSAHRFPPPPSPRVA